MMKQKCSIVLDEAIRIGKLELFFNEEGRFMLGLSGELTPKEKSLFETRPEVVTLDKHIFKKTFEDKYFPTMNGLEGNFRITQVNYEVIR